MKWILATASLLLFSFGFESESMYKTNSAQVNFISDAPLEMITASSSSCMGVFDSKSGEFAFRIPIQSFEGFNSPLQREHFLENYMEIAAYPYATFKGRVLDQVDTDLEGSLETTIKGGLEIHGQSTEMILPLELTMLKDGINFKTSFEVQLEHFEIEIPKVVEYKIARTIYIEVEGQLK